MENSFMLLSRHWVHELAASVLKQWSGAADEVICGSLDAGEHP